MPGKVNILDDFDAGFESSVSPEIGDTTDAVVEQTPEPEVVEPATKNTEPVEPPAPAVPQIDIQAVISQTVAEARKKDLPVEAAAPTAPAIDTAELEADDEFRKDWPSHAAKMDKLTSQIEQLRQMFESSYNSIQQQVAPVVASTAERAALDHENQIKAIHPDAYDLLPEINKWVSEQPDYLQDAYLRVMDTGNAKQVNTFLSAFKVATGRTMTLQSAVTERPTVAPVDNRLKRMEAPATVRTSISVEPDVDDFDTAFVQAAKKLEAKRMNQR
jgi:hypothetical protein